MAEPTPLPQVGQDDEGLIPDWARRALDRPRRTAPAQATAGAHAGRPEWPLLLDAALAADFLPRDLAPGGLDEEGRLAAEHAVLGFSETSLGSGSLRWALTREARRDVLDAARSRNELPGAVASSEARFTDPVSAALRSCLSGTAPAAHGEAVGLPDLEALRVAAAWVSGMPGVVELPPSDDLDREIELRRMFAGFERMVGRRDPGGAADAREDRFFGRDEELEQLRAHVGAVAAGTVRHRVARAWEEARRLVVGRAPLAVWGMGGVGKTTLIAKFMLEHARAAASRFPFAYLDFDRATVSSRDRAGLLAEMCAQVRAQFAELREPMAELRQRALEAGREGEAAGGSGEAAGALAPLLVEFREAVDRFLAGRESLLERGRPFLLVLDTFEVVQHGGGVERLEEFVEWLASAPDGSMWPRLRLVLAGRGEIDAFLDRLDTLRLGALDRAGSQEMLMALARDAGRPIGPDMANRIVAAAAKAFGGGARDGLSPLCLRLVGDVFGGAGAEEDGPAVARSLLGDLENPSSRGARDGVGQALVFGILVRRILGHVNSARVATLADPGLVVRRITPEVIAEVMARAVPRPANGDRPREADDADSDLSGFEPWAVAQAEAEEIFHEFERENSLVERDGDALRHRADIRRVMLPLIRARRPERFAALHRLAFEHFGRKAEADRRDCAAAAEAVYHGLWSDEPLDRLDRLWRGGGAFDLKVDPKEFLPERPAAAAYLRAKAGERLDPAQVALLPKRVAAVWLATRGKNLLAERRLGESVGVIRAIAGREPDVLDEHPAAAASAARLLYRAGLWGEAAEILLRHLRRLSFDEAVWLARRAGSSPPPGPWDDEDAGRPGAILSMLRTAATLDARSGVTEERMFPTDTVLHAVTDPVVRAEMLAFDVIAKPHGPNRGWLDETALHAVSPTLWLSQRKTLRLAALAGQLCAPALLPLYASAVGGGVPVGRSRELAVALRRLFGAIQVHAGSTGRVRALWAGSAQASPDEARAVLREEEAALKAAAREGGASVVADLRTLVLHHHADWARPLGNALARALRGEEEGGGDALRAWLREAEFLDEGPVRPVRRLRDADGIEVVRRAVEHGRVLEFAGLLRSFGPKAEAARYPNSLSALAGALLRWHEALDRAASPGEAGHSAPA